MSDLSRRDRVLRGACIQCGGQLSAGCDHCDGTGLEPEVPRWFYFSFVDQQRPEGARFIGGCYVKGSSIVDAVKRTHLLGINPGGELKAIEVPDDVLEQNVPANDRERLLSREEIERQN